MSKYTELMLKYIDGELVLNKAFQFEKIIIENRDVKNEYELNKRLDEYMRVQNMMQEIQNDPELAEIEFASKGEVSNHIFNEEDTDQSIAFFINGAITQNNELEELVDESEREIFTSGIDSVINEWVKEWDDERNQNHPKDKYTLELIDFVKSGMDDYLQPESRTIRNNSNKTRRLLVYLSSVAAVLLLGFGLTVLFNSKSGTNLYSQYYQPYKVVDGQTRSVDQQVNLKYKDALKLYNNRNFSQASDLFKELLNTDSNSAKIHLLYGISLMEEQKNNDAIINFKAIINNNGEYIIEAKWYLALAYIKIQDIKSAKILLNELTETPGYYKDKSKELLQKL